MFEPKLGIRAELCQLAERAINRAEKAFDLIFDAARRSTAISTIRTAQLSQQVLSFSEQSLKISLEHGRKSPRSVLSRRSPPPSRNFQGLRWPMWSTIFGSLRRRPDRRARPDIWLLTAPRQAARWRKRSTTAKSSHLGRPLETD